MFEEMSWLIEHLWNGYIIAQFKKNLPERETETT